jgi:hypothetical protein
MMASGGKLTHAHALNARRTLCGSEPLWRGGLPPLGREAAPKTAIEVRQVHRMRWFYDCYAAERGQAPSPQRFAPTGVDVGSGHR